MTVVAQRPQYTDVQEKEPFGDQEDYDYDPWNDPDDGPPTPAFPGPSTAARPVGGMRVLKVTTRVDGQAVSSLFGPD